MSHPYSSHKEGKVAKRRAKEMHGGAESGVGRMVKSAMAAHDKQQHGGKHTDLKVIGEYARGGRTKRGGKKKGNNTKINIAILGGDKGTPGGAPDLAGPPPAPPMAGPPPGPAAGLPPPGGMPGMPPGAPGMPPKGPPGMPGMMNRGGKVAMKGGAESGVGRLDKIKAYGGKAKKG